MSISKIATVTTASVFALLLSGCGATFSTVTIPKYDNPQEINMKVDQDGSAMGFLGVGMSLDKNYAYTFAVAATTTINAGYKYFSIVAPKNFVRQLEIRKVTNADEAYIACTDGDSSFATALSFRRSAISDGIGGMDGAKMKVSYNRCDSIHSAWSENTMTRGTVAHAPVSYTFTMHNNDLKDNVTFNAKEVLEAEIIEDLEPEYFVPMVR